LLPSALLGLAIMGNMFLWFESMESGIDDFPMTRGQALAAFGALIDRTYEMALPSMLLYLWLLIRIAIYSKKTPAP